MSVARLVTEGQHPPQEFPLGVRTTIGRTPDNDIEISNVSVSRHHAVVTFADNKYVIADLRSGNGTFVNDERIDQRLLAEGDRVEIGPTIFVFHAPEG
jgi:adenylate cyclase